MWGIAFCLNPRHWRLGWHDAKDEQMGREIVVGRWFCLGPVAITYDYE